MKKEEKLKKQKTNNVICRGTMCRTQNSNGITLVALIITIIILIILAGVSLNVALGENGIFKKSKNAVDKYKDAADTEDSILAQMDKQMKGLEYSAPWTGDADATWYNNTDTEFIITTAEQLAGFAELVNAGNTFEGKTVKLGQSIDLGATWDEEGNLISGKEWTPIGTESTAFSGTFDGDNYSIMRIYYSSQEGEEIGGLFQNNEGKIINIGINNGYIKSGSHTAGLVGKNSGLVENCYNMAKISGENQVAGIVA